MNKFLWFGIVSIIGTFALWFTTFRGIVADHFLYASIFFSGLSLALAVLKDPTDTQDDKDSSNWRAWAIPGLAAIGLFLPVVAWVVINSNKL